MLQFAGKLRGENTYGLKNKNKNILSVFYVKRCPVLFLN